MVRFNYPPPPLFESRFTYTYRHTDIYYGDCTKRASHWASSCRALKKKRNCSNPKWIITCRPPTRYLSINKKRVKSAVRLCDEERGGGGQRKRHRSQIKFALKITYLSFTSREFWSCLTWWASATCIPKLYACRCTSTSWLPSIIAARQLFAMRLPDTRNVWSFQSSRVASSGKWSFPSKSRNSENSAHIMSLIELDISSTTCTEQNEVTTDSSATFFLKTCSPHSFLYELAHLCVV